VSVCTANDWASIITGACQTNPDCIDALDMATYALASHRIEMRVPGATRADLCFQPDGDMFVSINGGTFATTAPAGAPWITGTGQDAVGFRIRRFSSGTQAGVERWVQFPFGSSPRFVL
jgi:hypothetical protein